MPLTLWRSYLSHRSRYFEHSMITLALARLLDTSLTGASDLPEAQHAALLHLPDHLFRLLQIHLLQYFIDLD